MVLAEEGELALLEVDVASRNLLDAAPPPMVDDLSARQIPHSRIGGSLRFDTQKLDAWMEEKAVEAAERR